jgi:three-Cys-motif partner protein
MEPVSQGSRAGRTGERALAVTVYVDREQTEAKHFILRHYLQALAFKVLHRWDAIAYIDGFSGPWESTTDNYSDTSFMIAIAVLKDAQQRIFESTGKRKTVKCFFAENDLGAFRQLDATVSKLHNPADQFEVKTYYGNFEDAVDEVKAFSGSAAFPLIFIDPTGWTGYPLSKIKPLFAPQRCEVLINFMYDFVNRAASMSDPKTIASLNPILGGPGWADRLDQSLERGLAVEKLFRETLKKEGNFGYVVSTAIEKSTADRPHFYLAYGTKNRAGLKAFRDTEYAALREHAQKRASAKERKREARAGTKDMFAGQHIEAQADTIDAIVERQKCDASAVLLERLAVSWLSFAQVVELLLQEFMLRETNVKDICVDLARDRVIENTWGVSNRKPSDDSPIRLS